MISLDTIEKEITELESRDTSYATVERLAWLYICRSNLMPKPMAQTVQNRSDSAFLRAVNGLDINTAMIIINEHMEAINAVFPKEYDAVIAKLEKAKETA